MYAIANVIYGFPVEIDFDFYYEDDENYDEDSPRILEECFENEEKGFLEYYSGSSENSPKAFGITISRFDECTPVKISNLNLVATLDIKNQYNEAYESLNEEVKNELKSFQEDFGEPQVFILWSSS